MLRYVRWTKVRGLGELQVLTKASYILLIAVPLLAALWPGVKIVINQYNESVHNTIDALDGASSRLQLELERMEYRFSDGDMGVDSSKILNKANTIIDNLDIKIKDLKQTIETATIHGNNLPSSWAILYVSALSVFFAHFIYQLSAPDIVKEKSFDEFVSSKKEEYSKNPTERTLQYSLHFANKYNMDLPERPQRPHEEFDKAVDRWELEIVEAGAQSFYLIQAGRKIPAIICSTLLYLIGIMCILIVLAKQSFSVIRAAGWA